MPEARETTQTENTAARAWVEAFAEGWRAPSGADEFAAHFRPWLQPDYRFAQPLMRGDGVGEHEFRERFARPLFTFLSDVRGMVVGWASHGDTIYIEMRVEARVGVRAITLRTCDRVTLRNGLAADRVAHLDPLPLLLAIFRTPRLWPRAARFLLENAVPAHH